MAVIKDVTTKNKLRFILKNVFTITELKQYIRRKYHRRWSTAYIYSLIRTGKLKSMKLFTNRIFFKDDIDNLAIQMKKTYHYNKNKEDNI